MFLFRNSAHIPSHSVMYNEEVLAEDKEQTIQDVQSVMKDDEQGFSNSTRGSWY